MTTKLQFIVTNFTPPRLFRNPAISNFFPFPLGLRNSGVQLQLQQVCTVTPYFGGGGIRGGVRENKLTLSVSCLLLFMTVGFEKLLYSLDLKMVLFFLLRKSFKRYNVQMSVCCHQRMQWSATMSSVCTDLLSQAQLKSPFGEFCFSPERRTKTVPIAGMAIKFENHKYPLLHY